MATAYKVLGQLNPSATTETSLYAVPAATSAVISSLVVCNLSTVATFRVFIRVGGGAGAGAAKEWLYYDVTLPANDTFVATLGITLGALDKLFVYASTANVAFSAYGSELT